MVSGAALRAASRVTPRMAAYRLKRTLRNLLARLSPALYASYVGWVVSSVPSIDRSTRLRDGSFEELAHSVAAYYHDEYIEVLDDVANGRFSLLNRTVDFGSLETMDWHHQLEDETDFHLWRQKLAHMGFVCPMLISGDEDDLNAVRRLIASYRKNADFGVPGCFSSYWFPYSVSHRILAILSGYTVAVQSRPLPAALCSEIEVFLRWNVGFLLANLEHDLRNNHVERNLAALCMYFSCVTFPRPRRSRRLDREVRRIMDTCILADGFSAERSAMYQGLSVMALEIFSKAECLSLETREVARGLHWKAVRAWHAVTHPDGEIGLFNDSWIGEVPRADHVTEHQNFAPVELLPEAGYARLESGGIFALMDAGPIGPRWCPGHGHADFLSVEIDVGNKRLIVDPGTYQYSTGSRRTFERSAASHNGPTRANLEPVEYTGCFRVGKMSEARFVLSSTSNESGSVRGRLDLRDGSALERTLGLFPGTLQVVDEWLVEDRGAFVRLTVSDAWVLTHQDAGSVSFQEGESTAQLSVLEGRIAGIERGEWSSRYLESRPAITVFLEPIAGEKKGRLVWEIRAVA